MATKLIQLMQDVITHGDIQSKEIVKIPSNRSIASAKGYWLDKLNDLIGGVVRKQNTYSDTELRIRMSKKILMNNGCGTVESVITATRYYLYLSDTNTWQSIEDKECVVYTSGNYIYIEVSGDNIESLDKVKEIQNYVAVGFGILIVSIFDDDTFQLYNDDGIEIDARRGLSDINAPSYGGKLASIIFPN